jgi:hypothetical protein
VTKKQAGSFYATDLNQPKPNHLYTGQSVNCMWANKRRTTNVKRLKVKVIAFLFVLRKVFVVARISEFGILSKKISAFGKKSSVNGF